MSMGVKSGYGTGCDYRIGKGGVETSTFGTSKFQLVNKPELQFCSEIKYRYNM